MTLHKTRGFFFRRGILISARRTTQLLPKRMFSQETPVQTCGIHIGFMQKRSPAAAAQQRKGQE